MKQSLWGRTKNAWKATRAFLAKDDNILSWLANLAVAFVVIKFILYPLLGLLFGSSLPVVAVVSSSMDHDSLHGAICGNTAPESYSGSLDDYWVTCGKWYEQRNITKEAFSEYPFAGGFNKGDIMVIVGPQRSTIRQGDVIVFEAQQRYPIIHRVIDAGPVLATKGDHNAAQIQDYVLIDENGGASRCERQGVPAPCFAGRPVTSATPGAVSLLDETSIEQETVIGKAVLRIPLLGYVKIWFTYLVQFLAGLFS